MDLCKPLIIVNIGVFYSNYALIMNSNKFIKEAKMYHISETLKHGPMDLESVNSGICSVKACIH